MKTFMFTPNVRSTYRRPFPLPVVAMTLAVLFASVFLTSCASMQGTKAEYFGYRNYIPAPAPEVEQEVSQQAWTNPMRSGVTSSVAFVPVVTPWYDSWSMFARPSARFWGMYDRFGWNSPFGFGGDPFWGGGFGMGFGGWGNPWAMNSFYDPFWGCNSSFMFYSSPWQRFNPYFGSYTPFGFYRPLGFWSSQNFGNQIGAVPGLGNNAPIYTPPQMRDFGTQRAYGNNAAQYTGANSYGNVQYLGNYSATGNGGALSRGQAPSSNEYKQFNPGNRASQEIYNARASAAGNYANYYSGTTNGGSNTKYNSYNSSQVTRYYSAPPSTGGRSGYGDYGRAYNSGYGNGYGSGSYNSSSSGSWGRSSSGGGYSGSSSGGSYSGSSSGGSYSGSSSGGSYGGSSGGGARSRGGN